MPWLLAVLAGLLAVMPLCTLRLGAMFALLAPRHIRTSRVPAMLSSRVVLLPAWRAALWASPAVAAPLQPLATSALPPRPVALWVRVARLLLQVVLRPLVPAAACALALALPKAAPVISALRVGRSATLRIRAATLTLLVVTRMMVAVSWSVPAPAVVRCFSLVATVFARMEARWSSHPVLAWLVAREAFRLAVRIRAQGAAVFRSALDLSQAVPRDLCRFPRVLLGAALQEVSLSLWVPALPVVAALLSFPAVPAVLRPAVTCL
jgi:hypothetical protein